MKLFNLVLSTLIPIMTATASDIPFYLGTYTNTPASQGIYRGTLNTETGALSPLTLAAATKNPSFLAFSPDRKFLYSVNETAVGAANSFRVEADGQLTHLNEQPSEGGAPCHLSVDPSGRNVLVANYSGGNVIVFPLQPDGSLGARTAIVPFSGKSAHPQRQDKPHAHSIYADADNHFVYACDLGTDSVWTFKFDPARGTLTPTDPPAGKVAPGAGPRHLAFAANGKIVYSINELDLTVTVFSRNPATGSLTAIQAITTLPEGASREGTSTAEIALHPNGRWLYASNRGHDSITVYAVAPDGKLSWVDNTPALVQQPRSFAIDPSGQWIVAAGQGDGKVAVLKIDPATGKLSATKNTLTTGAPVCVLF